MNWTDFWYIVLIAALFIMLLVSIIWYFSLRRKRKTMPSHLQLYFDDNFRKIMTEWDFVSRDRVKTFKKDIGARLSKVGTDIDGLEKRRSGLDSRMKRIETRIEKLEGS
jgi:hypothetical protein